MTVKPTSREAFLDHIRSGKDVTQRELIHDYIKKNPDCTRNQIEAGTGVRISSVTARVNELLDNDDVKVNGTGEDPVTGKNVEMLTSTDGWEIWKKRIDKGVM